MEGGGRATAQVQDTGGTRNQDVLEEVLHASSQCWLAEPLVDSSGIFWREDLTDLTFICRLEICFMNCLPMSTFFSSFLSETAYKSCVQRPLSQLLCFALHFSSGDGVRVHGHSKFLAEKLPAVKEAAELQKGSKVYITLEGVNSSHLFYLLARFYTG